MGTIESIRPSGCSNVIRRDEGHTSLRNRIFIKPLPRDVSYDFGPRRQVPVCEYDKSNRQVTLTMVSNDNQRPRTSPNTYALLDVLAPALSRTQDVITLRAGDGIPLPIPFTISLAPQGTCRIMTSRSPWASQCPTNHGTSQHGEQPDKKGKVTTTPSPKVTKPKGLPEISPAIEMIYLIANRTMGSNNVRKNKRPLP